MWKKERTDLTGEKLKLEENLPPVGYSVEELGSLVPIVIQPVLALGSVVRKEVLPVAALLSQNLVPKCQEVGKGSRGKEKEVVEEEEPVEKEEKEVEKYAEPGPAPFWEAEPDEEVQSEVHLTLGQLQDALLPELQLKQA